MKETLAWLSNADQLCCSHAATCASRQLKRGHEVVMRGWVKVFLIMVLLPILVGGVVLFIAGRPVAFEVLKRRTANKFPDVKWISSEDLGRWLDDKGQPQPVLLDARTPSEFELSHLKGARRIDPYRPSLKPLHGFPRDTSMVVYSSAGYRSARVAAWLGKAGYTGTSSLAGGVFKWANEGKPLFKEENRPTAVVHPYDRRWGLLVEGRYRAEAGDVEPQSAAP
jgi:rhodanese-related sulfurtransferase